MADPPMRLILPSLNGSTRTTSSALRVPQGVVSGPSPQRTTSSIVLGGCGRENRTRPSGRVQFFGLNRAPLPLSCRKTTKNFWDDIGTFYACYFFPIKGI